MAKPFEVVVSGEAVDLVPNVNRALDKAVELMGIDVWGNVIREVPTDEGVLGGSFELDRTGQREWTISTNVKYANFVNEGTGINGPAGRRITPKRASVLVFKWLGKTWYRRSVAGQKPNKYADRAVKLSASRAKEFADIAVREVFG